MISIHRNILHPQDETHLFLVNENLLLLGSNFEDLVEYSSSVFERKNGLKYSFFLLYTVDL